MVQALKKVYNDSRIKIGRLRTFIIIIHHRGKGLTHGIF